MRGKAGQVDFFSPSNGALLHSVPIRRAPANVLLSTGGTCIAADMTAKRLRVLSLRSKRGRTAVLANSNTYTPVFNPSGGRVCMYGRFRGAISRVSPVGHAIMHSIGMLHRPGSTRFDGSNGCLFIAGCLPSRQTSLSCMTTYISIVEVSSFAGMGSVGLTGNDGTLHNVYVAPSNGCVCMSRGLKHFAIPASRLRRK